MYSVGRDEATKQVQNLSPTNKDIIQLTLDTTYYDGNRG